MMNHSDFIFTYEHCYHFYDFLDDAWHKVHLRFILVEISIWLFVLDYFQYFITFGLGVGPVLTLFFLCVVSISRGLLWLL